MRTESVELRTGEELVVRVMEPPLLDYARKTKGSELLQWCWEQIREEMLGGHMKQWLYAPYFLGEIDGELVASMTYYTPTDTRDVGVVEFVQTAEAHREKGIASAVLGRLVEQFTGAGGLALYLCTTNPAAGPLYEQHGFWYHVGDGMRYLSPEAQDFDDTYLAFTGSAKPRDATWGDLPRASVLYNHPEPNWLIKDYLTQTFRNTRYESHFLKLMRRVEDDRGAFVVLESPEKRVVGAAALERSDSYLEQHVATLSFRVAPEYLRQTRDLLEAAADRARAQSITILEVYLADYDREQKELLTAAGFSEEARLRNRLRNGDEWMDMVVFTKSLSDDAPPFRSEAEYYGSRQPWQVDRAADRRPS